jgi:hypothetical protein
VPAEANATDKEPPAEMWITNFRESAPLFTTPTGTLLEILVPLPNCPNPLNPQLYTVPSEANANENPLTPPLPPETWIIILPRRAPNIFTATGILLERLVPLPNCPDVLFPHANTSDVIIG